MVDADYINCLCTTPNNSKQVIQQKQTSSKVISSSGVEMNLNHHWVCYWHCVSQQAVSEPAPVSADIGSS